MMLPISSIDAPDSTLRVSPWLVVAIAGPAVVTTLAVLVFISSEMLGQTPLALWPSNIAEAAGLGNGAETLRLLRLARDPSRPEAVRPEIISSSITRATALEAAVFARKVELVRLLDGQHTMVGREPRQEMACLAKDIQANDIVEYLEKDGKFDCEPGAARARVEARSAPATGR